MVCVDQRTAEKMVEPFATLAKTRRRGAGVWFGVHTAVAGGGGGTAAGGGGKGWIMAGDGVKVFGTGDVGEALSG